MSRVIIGFLALLAACAEAPPEAGLPEPAEEIPEVEMNGPSARVIQAGLEVSLTLDRASYVTHANTIRCITEPCPSNAEPPVIHARIALRNLGAEPTTIDLTSGQRFDLQVLDASGTILQTWSADKMFMQGMDQIALGAGEEVAWTDSLVLVPDMAGDLVLRATVMGVPTQVDVPIRVELAGS